MADGSLNAQSEEQKLMAQLSLHHCSHVLYPPFFDRADDLPDLSWQKLDFKPESRVQVPRQKGVYAFALELAGSSLLPVTHILYVGKAGDVNSNNTLWRRYYDYIRTERVGDRVRIAQMLRQWKGCLSYYYAVVDEGTSTGDVEETLLDILIPPFNRGD
ncbi:MAG: hypothetical protein V3T17_17155, partial [Pseudomonadales bacterium]